MKKIVGLIVLLVMMITSLTGCGSESADQEVSTIQIKTKTGESIEYYEAGRAYLYGLDDVEIDLEKAYDNFQKAVELGKNEANFYLGTLYYWYNYPECNFQMAKEYFEKCTNNPYAEINLGLMYYNGHGVLEDVQFAESKFQKTIEEGYAEGYFGSAMVECDKGNYDVAYKYYNKVIDEGTEQLFVASAIGSIAFLYEEGYGVESDYIKAMELYEKAANMGHGSSFNGIGLLYQEGLGVEQDYIKALEYLEKAIYMGRSDAMCNLATMYYNGLGVEKDYTKAAKLYKKAAELEDAIAMSNLGTLYCYGLGVEQDYAKALEFYEKAAEKGHGHAMYNIGFMYDVGMGVEQNYETALGWFSKGAFYQNPDAMNMLGLYYYQGKAVEQNYETALVWFESATNLGSEKARENAESLRQKME